MKKTGLVLTMLGAALAATACGPAKEDETKRTKLYVFAAASMTETLQELEKKYEAKNKDTDLVFNFDSSGTLKTQIENGAKCDVFISAAQKQMNGLADQNLVKTETRFDFLENKVSLVVPEGNPKHILDFGNMCNRLQAKEDGFILAMGNDDVPVGQYTQKILTSFGVMQKTGDVYSFVDPDVEDHHVSYCGNVKLVAAAVQESSVSCGVVYRTDAFSNHLVELTQATEEMCGRVVYPAALISKTKQETLGKKYLEYLKSEEATKVFEKVGFVALANN